VTIRLPSEKEQLILRLLADGEWFAQELIKASKGKLGRGTAYVTLRRMAEKGLIKEREIQPPPDWPGGQPRPFYSLAPSGREALKALDMLDKLSRRRG
jgi:DNA-binding PadR family transcriptional regulator